MPKCQCLTLTTASFSHALRRLPGVRKETSSIRPTTALLLQFVQAAAVFPSRASTSADGVRFPLPAPRKRPRNKPR